MSPITRYVGVAASAAAVMYWFDPTWGRRRRALFRDRATRIATDMSHTAGVASRDMNYRARGLRARLRAIFARDEVTDEVLAARLRTALGRTVSHPRAIDVEVSRGQVKLTGSILAHEHDELLEAVFSARGVIDVVDELGVYEDSRGVSNLQGGRTRARTRFVLQRETWPPAARFLVGGAGGAIGAWGARQLAAESNSFLGATAIAAGTILLLRSTLNVPVRRMASATGHRAIELQKSIYINAELEQVFNTLRDFESFPTFMRNVRSVRIHPNGHTHWVVAGPAGASVEWDSEVTVLKPNELLGWRTVANAPVAHVGIIRFERAGAGTRLHVRMSYNPPGGWFGYGVARLFGADPKRELDEDLLRLKCYVETGEPPRDAAQVQAAKATSSRSEAAATVH